MDIDQRRCMIGTMTILVIFCLGIANFALHRAVLESSHPAFGRLPRAKRVRGGRITLATEFLVLVAAMMLAANGWGTVGWIYGLYFLLNLLAAWLILTGRV